MSGSNWCRTEFEISKTDLEWNVQVPCLETTTQWMEPLDSTLFSAKSTPDRQWKMQLSDMATDIKIQLFLTTPGIAHYNSARIFNPKQKTTKDSAANSSFTETKRWFIHISVF